MPAGPNGDAYVQAAALSAPQPVNSWTEFTQQFGDIQAGNQYLAHAVYGFFNNGGTRCWVARIAAAGRPGQNVGTRAGAVREHRRDRPRRRAAAAGHRRRRAQRRPGGADRALREDGGPRRDPRQRPRHHGRQPGDHRGRQGIWRPAANPKGYGAFYFPWIEVADPLGSAGRARRRAAERPRRRRLRPQSTPSAACTRRRPTRCVRGALGRALPGQQEPAGRPQPARHQLHPPLRRHHQGLRRAHAGVGPGRATPSGSTSTSAGCSTSCASRSTRARSGSCSSRTPPSCGRRSGATSARSSTRVGVGRAVRRDAGAGVLRALRRDARTRPRSATWARSSPRSAWRSCGPPSS